MCCKSMTLAIPQYWSILGTGVMAEAEAEVEADDEQSIEGDENGTGRIIIITIVLMAFGARVLFMMLRSM